MWVSEVAKVMRKGRTQRQRGGGEALTCGVRDEQFCFAFDSLQPWCSYRVRDVVVTRRSKQNRKASAWCTSDSLNETKKTSFDCCVW
jgi:hypothetical protein